MTKCGHMLEQCQGDSGCMSLLMCMSGAMNDDVRGLSSSKAPAAFKNDPLAAQLRAGRSAIAQKGLVDYNPDAFNYISKILQSKVYDVCTETPTQFAPNLTSKLGSQYRIMLKREDLQPVFSFKLRGAYNKMVNLSQEERQAGLVCCSAGNHAQGVAFGAAKLGLSAKIFMPKTTPEIKVDAVRRYKNAQSEVCLVGSSYDEAYAACMECLEQEGRTLVHPFDDPDVIAGQGTIGQEIVKQTSAENLEAVFACVGGGGLVSGVGVYLKSVMPWVKLIGVEAADAAGMTASLEAGRVVTLDSVGLFADGAAVKRIGDETFRLTQMVVDEMVTVSTDEICAAIQDAFFDTRIILEPAGALAVAGMKQWVKRNPRPAHPASASGEQPAVVGICSGANMDFGRLRFVSERCDTSESLVHVTIPEEPGAFWRLYESVYPRNVTEFAYRIMAPAGATPPNDAQIFMSFQAHSEEDRQHVFAAWRKEGFGVEDLQDNELAKTHVRHLVSGRADRDLVEGEVLLRFEFPERPGSLRNFLEQLPRSCNVSLFHYRNHGADVGRVLVGLQVPAGAGNQFWAQIHKLGYHYVDETRNPVYRKLLTKEPAR